MGAPSAVLVVEDETALRASMVAGLAKVPGLEVTGVETLSAAIAALDSTPPAVVVSDIDLPDGLGVSLIGELTKRRLHVPIVFVTAYRAAYGSLIPPHAGVDVLEKPVSLDKLRSVVAARAGAGEGPASPFAVADYVQLSCMGRHTVTIDVTWRDGAGRVAIVRGELWSAADPRGTGAAAFRRLAFRHDVAIRCVATDVPAGPRNIESSWEAVLLEAARVQDEEARASHPEFTADELRAAASLDDFALEEPSTTTPDSPSAVTSPSAESVQPAVDAFATACDQAIGALMAKDYAAAADAFDRAHALRPEDAKVSANVRRLRDMGYGGAGTPEGGPS